MFKLCLNSWFKQTDIMTSPLVLCNSVNQLSCIVATVGLKGKKTQLVTGMILTSPKAKMCRSD